MSGGGSKWTEEYISGLPEVGHPDLLYDRTDRSPVRIGRKVYEYATHDGTWEPVFTIPDDYATSSTVPGTESPDGAIPGLLKPSGTSPRSSNPFFPQLVPEYTPQGLLDWSEYMPEGGMFGHEQYQPWTNPNSIPENIFNYQPPMIHASAGGSAGGSGGSFIPVGLIGGPTTTTVGSISDDPWSDYPAGDRHLPRPDGGGPDRGLGGADVDTMSPHVPGNGTLPTERYQPTFMGPPSPASTQAVPIGPSGYPSIDLAAKAAQAAQAAAAAEADRERQLAHNLARIASTYGQSDHQQEMAEAAIADLMGQVGFEVADRVLPTLHGWGGTNPGTQPGGAPSGGHHAGLDFGGNDSSGGSGGNHGGGHHGR